MECISLIINDNEVDDFHESNDEIFELGPRYSAYSYDKESGIHTIETNIRSFKYEFVPNMTTFTMADSPGHAVVHDYDDYGKISFSVMEWDFAEGKYVVRENAKFFVTLWVTKK